MRGGHRVVVGRHVPGPVRAGNGVRRGRALDFADCVEL